MWYRFPHFTHFNDMNEINHFKNRLFCSDYQLCITLSVKRNFSRSLLTVDGIHLHENFKLPSKYKHKINIIKDNIGKVNGRGVYVWWNGAKTHYDKRIENRTSELYCNCSNYQMPTALYRIPYGLWLLIYTFVDLADTGCFFSCLTDKRRSDAVMNF